MQRKTGQKNTATAPWAELRNVDGAITLFLHGDWTVYTVEAARLALSKIIVHKSRFAHIDLAGISHMDTSGALLINSVILRVEKEGQPKRLNSNPNFEALLDLSKRAARPKPPREPQPNTFIRACNSTGHTIVQELYFVADIISFFGLMVLRCIQSIKQPKDINFAALVNQIEQIGVRCIPILALLTFLVGLVIAYMGAAQLVLFGAQIFVVGLLEIGVLREMGVLITAIMVAGRSGSAFTAQIGAMVSTEEVRAMQSMGIDPMVRLVIPRVLALLICLPFLVIIADIMSLIGGLVAMWISLDISPTVFINTLHENISVRNLLVGVLKAPFFAVVIGCVGCFLGFKVTGSVDSIGSMTTRSVVESIFLVIMLDAIFALILSIIGV